MNTLINIARIGSLILAIGLLIFAKAITHPFEAKIIFACLGVLMIGIFFLLAKVGSEWW